MHFSYILPILPILFNIVATSDIDSAYKTFVDLCFLPKSRLNYNLSNLIAESEDEDPFYAVIGNKVMQEKLYQLLTDKNVPSEDLDKMCAKASVESIDEKGVSFGKIWGFENLTSTYTCQATKDFHGVERCNFASASKKFDEDTLMFLDIANENVTMEIDCYKSGQVGWVLYSRNPSLSEEDKNSYFARAKELGFPENTNVVMHSKECAV